MSKRQDAATRNATTGKFTVGPKTVQRGKEIWTIHSTSRVAAPKTVITSSSSAASLDRIGKQHAKALKRLADK